MLTAAKTISRSDSRNLAARRKGQYIPTSVGPIDCRLRGFGQAGRKHYPALMRLAEAGLVAAQLYQPKVSSRFALKTFRRLGFEEQLYRSENTRSLSEPIAEAMQTIFASRFGRGYEDGFSSYQRTERRFYNLDLNANALILDTSRKFLEPPEIERACRDAESLTKQITNEAQHANYKGLLPGQFENVLGPTFPEIATRLLQWREGKKVLLQDAAQILRAARPLPHIAGWYKMNRSRLQNIVARRLNVIHLMTLFGKDLVRKSIKEKSLDPRMSHWLEASNVLLSRALGPLPRPQEEERPYGKISPADHGIIVLIIGRDYSAK